MRVLILDTRPNSYAESLTVLRLPEDVLFLSTSDVTTVSIDMGAVALIDERVAVFPPTVKLKKAQSRVTPTRVVQLKPKPPPRAFSNAPRRPCYRHR